MNRAYSILDTKSFTEDKDFLTIKGIASTPTPDRHGDTVDPMGAEFTVPMDQVRMITFQAPISTVFVGNPQIADVTVVDSTRIFLMGKNFGTTNLVALDADGNQLSNGLQ